jgi:DNA-binding transcriptional regulator YhcF (GntR family)
MNENKLESVDVGQRTFNGADTYTPLSSFLCEAYGLNVSAIFGKIWNLSRREGYSYMSNNEMAKQLGINPHTVGNSIKEMIELKLINDVSEKYKERHQKKKGKYTKKIPFHKQVKFYEPNPKVLEKLKKEFYS